MKPGKKTVAILLCLAMTLTILQGTHRTVVHAKQVYSCSYLAEHLDLVSTLKEGDIVTVSSVTDLACMRFLPWLGTFTDTGIVFLQTQDIAFSSYCFQYDASNKRAEITNNGDVVGYADSDGNTYKSKCCYRPWNRHLQ